MGAFFWMKLILYPHLPHYLSSITYSVFEVRTLITYSISSHHLSRKSLRVQTCHTIEEALATHIHIHTTITLTNITLRR